MSNCWPSARQGAAPSLPFPIVGSDLDPAAIESARENARRAGVAEDVRFDVAHYDVVRPPAPAGTLVVNPPYDERMKVPHLAAVYRRIGDALKQNWSGYTAFVFTGNMEAAKQIGLRPSRKIRLFNGAIRCQLLRYELRGARLDANKDSGELIGRVPGSSTATEILSAEGFSESESESESENRTSEAQADFLPHVSQESLAPVAAAPIASTHATVRRQWQAQAVEFRNRLLRMGKHWKKWARRQGITCFRLYDRDVPEVPLAIDWYDGNLAVAEYVRPHDRTEIEHDMWLERMMETLAEALEVDPQQVTLKRRRRQRGPAQYERQSEEGRRMLVGEGGHKFEVNLSDYLDTGLFLDHRITRAMVEREARGKRFLNLFGYTGAFTVYAAAGGAAETTTVDLSNTYLDWARRNLQHNGLAHSRHRMIRDDAVGFLRHQPQRRGGLFDLAVVDPPTFSNSKRTPDIWDVQRDHVEVLNLVLDRLAPGGKIFFSTNFRRFKFQQEELRGATVREISRQTVPPDFRNKRIHRCWTIVRAGEKS